MKDSLYIVIPVYNEEDIISNSIDVISDKLNELIKRKKVNNKSKDFMKQRKEMYKTIKYIK